MILGLNYIYALPAQSRHPETTRRELSLPPAADLLEPAPAWSFSARGGWQPCLALSPEGAGARRPGYFSAGAWQQRTGACSLRLLSPPAPSPVGSGWETFEFLATLNFVEQTSLPELHLGQRIAARLMAHCEGSHEQGLKVFYMTSGESTLVNCPPYAANPARPLMHAALAKGLLAHPEAADKLLVRRAIVASKALAPQASMRSAVWAPQMVGGTRLVLRRPKRASHKAAYLSLEPSEQYGHACTHGPLFERLAAFHANVLQLSGSIWPIVAKQPHMRSLALRIEALRSAASSPLEHNASLGTPTEVRP